MSHSYDSATVTALTEMLTENTGRHFLDSGDAYGRHWQRNQGLTEQKLLDTTPGTLGGLQYKELTLTLDVFHFLADRLEICPERTESLQAFGRGRDEPWLASIDAWIDLAQNLPGGMEIGGIYGEGAPLTVNTYNGEDALSQVIQYTYWTEGVEGAREAYIALQIHGGADVRGGYTAPRVFRVTDDEGTSIFDNARGTIACSKCDAHWDTDNAGHSWYFEGACGVGAGRQLDDYPMTLLDEDDARTPAQAGLRSHVVVSADRKRCSCPVCGKGELHAYTYPIS